MRLNVSARVMTIIDNAISAQLDTINLAKDGKLALELLQARRDIRTAQSAKPDAPDETSV